MQNRREFLDVTIKGMAGAWASGLVSSAYAAQTDEIKPLPRDKLIEALKAVGKPPRLVENPDGTKVLLLPYGGRVLGLYAPNSEENFYWTHPALSSADTAKSFYESDVWHNSGGDRTWLAPEVDIFFPEYPNTKTYWQPRELDPGNYKVVQTPDGIRLVNRLSVTLSRSKEKMNLEIAKSVSSAPNPLRHERGLDLRDLEYAGYTQFTSLAVVDNRAESGVGLWNLVQMPHGGDLLVPTYVRATPKICFGSIPPEDLIVEDHLVRYHMRQTGEHKLEIRAVATCGRVGYVYKSGERWALIIRNFTVNPSGEYVDVPWTDTEDFGYSTQACNVNSALGCFSELEYHIPAIGKGTGRMRCDDAAQVWAFRGGQGAIRAVMGRLLTPRWEPEP